MKTLHQMSLLAILLVCGFEIKNSVAQMNIQHVINFFKGKCYSSGEVLYAQAQTLESVLHLVEKFELANPEISLEKITATLLKNYTIERLKHEGNDFKTDVPRTFTKQYWAKMLSLENADDQNNPYEDSELCSLFNMLSHTVNDTAWPNEENTFRSPRADSTLKAGVLKAGVLKAGENKTSRPREQGAVSIQMTAHSVALGRVIAGIYLGLSQGGMEVDLSELLSNEQKENLGDSLNTIKEKGVNLFYVLTINDVLTLSSWKLDGVATETKINEIMGENGVWNTFHSPSLGPYSNETEICPNVYRHDKTTPYFTYSLIRGSMDGVILGNLVHENPDLEVASLSQLLRMYYSKKGIYSSKTQDIISVCRRKDLIGRYSEAIKKYVRNAIYLLSETYDMSLIEQRKKNIDTIYDYLVQNTDVTEYQWDKICSATIEDEQHLGCETPSDVIAVIDTSTSNKNIEKQKMILGYLANNLKLWHQGSKMTILNDRSNGTIGLGLEEILPETSSSPCVACNITQQIIEEGSSDKEEDFVIQSIDKYLQDKKDSETDLNGVPGKVLIYFNFASEETSTARLEKALTDLRLRHLDTAFFAIGTKQEVLKKYVRNNDKNALEIIDDLKSLAKDLAGRICLSSADLQYSDCERAKDEKNAVYHGVVTPNFKQYWAMSPKYFLKSYNTIIWFKAIEGDIRVCHNRASTPPDISDNKNCKQSNSTYRDLDFPHRHPCKGFDEMSCGEMTFLIIGVENKNNDAQLAKTFCKNKEDSKACKTIDQIRFKVTHDGIRCSGCSGLASTLSSIMIALLLYLIFTRNAHS